MRHNALHVLILGELLILCLIQHTSIMELVYAITTITNNPMQELV